MDKIICKNGIATAVKHSSVAPISDTFCNDAWTIFELAPPIHADYGGKFNDIHGAEVVYVQVSDARTHIERIVMPIVPADDATIDDLRHVMNGGSSNKQYVCKRLPHIEGQWTMSIDGGDMSTIEPVQNYLERLFDKEASRQ